MENDSQSKSISKNNQMSEKYVFIKKIRKFCLDKLVLNKETNELCLQRNYNFQFDEGLQAQDLREIVIMKKLSSNYVTKILETKYIDENELIVYYEYFENSLVSYIDNIKKDRTNINTLNKIKTAMYLILSAVNYIHSKNVIHRGLSTRSFLIDVDKSLTKIFNFELGRVYRLPIRPYTIEITKICYRPPEIFLGLDKYSIGVDIWSLGCIFVEFFKEKCLFMAETEIEFLFKIFEVLGTPNDGDLPGFRYFSNLEIELPNYKGIGLREYIKRNEVIPMPDVAFDLIEQMLCYDPCLRISAKDALKHVRL